MRRTISTGVLAAVLGVAGLGAGAAWAGGGASAEPGLPGFACDHVCPLAREANEHRSAGSEAAAKAPSVRAAIAAGIERNLRRL